MKGIMQLDSMAVSLRKRLGEDSDSPVDIFSLAADIENLTLVLYPLGKNISGICVKMKENNLIAINSDMSIGRQRFSLAHEFYHLFFDNRLRTSVSFRSFDPSDEAESEADKFASHFLIPSSAFFERFSFDKEVTPENIIQTEQLFGLSRKAMLFRLIEENLISDSFSKRMERDVRKTASAEGYDIKLYEPSPENEKKKTTGQYIRLVNELYNNESISDGKFEELLLDAFREDLVFNIDDDAEENVD